MGNIKSVYATILGKAKRKLSECYVFPLLLHFTIPTVIIIIIALSFKLTALQLLA
jgi:hypothetical protein